MRNLVPETCARQILSMCENSLRGRVSWLHKLPSAYLKPRIYVVQGDHAANRIFYLAVPQEALLDVALSLADRAQTKRGWNRVIIEKPFGFDEYSSNRLTQTLLSKFQENQIYRSISVSDLALEMLFCLLRKRVGNH